MNDTEARYWFARAAVNARVAQVCKDAGFTEAAEQYAVWSIIYLSNGFRALGNAQKSTQG